MCGIFGAVRKKSKGKTTVNLMEFPFLCNLAEETEVRGNHATGFAAMTLAGKLVVDKAPVPARKFITMSSAWCRLAGNPVLGMIGHTRLATSGTPADNRNNHPHSDGGLHLVHNGMIWYYTMQSLRKQFKCVSGCDSEIILRIILSEKKVLDGIKKAFKLVDGGGAMACALLDNRNRRLWLWRDDRQPLYICKGDGVVYFASTGELLTRADSHVPGHHITPPKPLWDNEVQEYDLDSGRCKTRIMPSAHKGTAGSEKWFGAYKGNSYQVNAFGTSNDDREYNEEVESWLEGQAVKVPF